MAVHLGVEGPRPQRRMTVALRVILAIPHYVIGALVLGAIALFVIVLAWFAALLTARVPYGIADFLARVLQYQARMYGYGQLLLTDRFPPFAVGPADHPIELAFDEVGRFNRAAVLFRAILMLPAVVVTQIAVGGALVAMIVLWLVTLVAGRMPDAAHMALASVLRYQMRTYAYVGLVTTEYPSGLFGDAEPETIDGEPPTTPHITRFVLSRAAKNVLVAFLVIGTALQAVNAAGSVRTASRSFAVADELDDGYADLLDASQVWSSLAGSCTTSECLRDSGANLRFDRELARFQRRIEAVDLPASADDDAEVVHRDLAELRTMLRDFGDVERLRLQVVDAMFELDEDYQHLYNAVLEG